jgi:hypothetical protein
VNRPRIRTIKPEFFRDEKIQRLPVPARLLMIGLISHADDEGRLDGDPRSVGSQVFPLDGYSASRIDAWLELIAEAGIIHRYHAIGIDWIEIKNWHHQKINRPTESRIPSFQESLNGHAPITHKSLSDH